MDPNTNTSNGETQSPKPPRRYEEPRIQMPPVPTHPPLAPSQPAPQNRQPTPAAVRPSRPAQQSQDSAPGAGESGVSRSAHAQPARGADQVQPSRPQNQNLAVRARAQSQNPDGQRGGQTQGQGSQLRPQNSGGGQSQNQVGQPRPQNSNRNDRTRNPNQTAGYQGGGGRGNQPQNRNDQSRHQAQGAPGQGGGAQGGGGQGGQPRGDRAVSGAVSRERRRLTQQAPSHTDLVPSLDTMPVNKSPFNGFAGTQQSKSKGAAAARGPANQAVRVPTIRVMPLGGLGEIGKNMMAIESGNDIVIIDMGFAFPDKNQPGVDYIIPDTTYLERNKHKVRAIIITHGHMDHIGAAGYIIPKFPVSVYGSRLSLAMVAKQIEEFKIHTPQFMTLDPDKGERVQVGSFGLELVRVNHTIADSTAVVLRTPAGIIINTGDWRIDPSPLNGQFTDMKRFAELGDEGVLLLMSDSTSCDRAGRGGSEIVIVPVIEDLFGRAQGRIIISAFSSSITRMQLIVDACVKANRKLALVGRSVLANIELCVRMGYIKIPQGLLIRAQDASNYPDTQVVVLCTGSQGEENSALVRMSTGDHQNIKIKPGDTIILSSSVIPGNEVSIVQLLDNLMREGAAVYARSTQELKDHGPVHVGGHAQRDDQADMIAAVRPKFYMPIHGEFHHLVYNAEIALEGGMSRDNVFVMDNGDCLELTAETAKKVARIPAGVVMIDGAGIGDVEGVVLRDRLALSSDGVFMIVATVSRKTGRLISSPDIISRGFIYMKENEDLINKARAEVRRIFEKRTSQDGDWTKFKLKLRDEIGDILYSKTKRNPMVLPVINEV